VDGKRVSDSAASTQATLSLPKGGGAIRGIGETFQATLFSGTANHSVPIALSAGRGGFGPKLSLDYDSGSGNGIFGLGWQLSLPGLRARRRRACRTMTITMSSSCRARKIWSDACAGALIRTPVA
jgi:hypothetical protein